MIQDQVAAGEAALSQRCPVLAQLIAQHRPCGIAARKRDPFHTLCLSIVSQQLSSKAADTIYGRVATHVGAKGKLKPQQLIAADTEALRRCGLSYAKVKWLKALAASVDSGQLSFAKLRKMDDEAALQALDDLPGIGRWTAEMYLIFALDRLDIFSMGDVGLRNAVNRLYGKGRKLSDRRTLQLTAAWAPYRSIASWYLWRSGDAKA
ncbi:MAG TPA: DNA-3-methyladenine glycosylase 2 family protein [Solimonas sp.]|nr:DNA-3-methyladenine glycosylase 2 family protein [Solimonas sp.]